MWKEAAMHWFEGLPWIFRQGLRKTAKVFPIVDEQAACRVLNSGPLECKAAVQSSWQHCSVLMA
jgi:hypothetical protein